MENPFSHGSGAALVLFLLLSPYARRVYRKYCTRADNIVLQDFHKIVEKTLLFRGGDALYQILCSNLISTLAWAVLFGLVCFLTQKRMSFLSSWRCVRFLHSVIIVIAADKAVITGAVPFVESAGQNTPYHNLILTLSEGFLLFSTVCLGIKKQMPWRMMMGYVFFILTFAANMMVQECGAELMIGILVRETSAGLSQFREIVQSSLLSENGWIFKTLDWIYLLALLFVAVFVGTLSFLLASIDPFINPVVKLGYLVSYLLGIKTVFSTGVYFKRRYFTKHKSA